MHTEEEIACACVDGRIGGWADAYFMRLSSSSGFRPPTLSEMAFSDFSWLTTKTTAFTCSFCGAQGWQADEGNVSTGSEGNEGEERGTRPSRACTFMTAEGASRGETDFPAVSACDDPIVRVCDSFWGVVSDGLFYFLLCCCLASALVFVFLKRP